MGRGVFVGMAKGCIACQILGDFIARPLPGQTAQCGQGLAELPGIDESRSPGKGVARTGTTL